ncbi:hypothetical protein BDZ89DRAFT_1059297 [Hymenopellis radicata]|nr:hypothetical protein BDZ89DRAFT_1059297 [Hymenopellis radicata]
MSPLSTASWLIASKSKAYPHCRRNISPSQTENLVLHIACEGHADESFGPRTETFDEGKEYIPSGYSLFRNIRSGNDDVGSSADLGTITICTQHSIS